MLDLLLLAHFPFASHSRTYEASAREDGSHFCHIPSAQASCKFKQVWKVGPMLVCFGWPSYAPVLRTSCNSTVLPFGGLGGIYVRGGLSLSPALSLSLSVSLTLSVHSDTLCLSLSLSLLTPDVCLHTSILNRIIV